MCIWPDACIYICTHVYVYTDMYDCSVHTVLLCMLSQNTDMQVNVNIPSRSIAETSCLSDKRGFHISC
jgi:hypothetical protein